MWSSNNVLTLKEYFRIVLSRFWSISNKDLLKNPDLTNYSFDQHSTPDLTNYSFDQHSTPDLTNYSFDQHSTPDLTNYSFDQHSTPNLTNYSFYQHSTYDLTNYSLDQHSTSDLTFTLNYFSRIQDFTPTQRWFLWHYLSKERFRAPWARIEAWGN